MSTVLPRDEQLRRATMRSMPPFEHRDGQAFPYRPPTSLIRVFYVRCRTPLPAHQSASPSSPSPARELELRRGRAGPAPLRGRFIAGAHPQQRHIEEVDGQAPEESMGESPMMGGEDCIYRIDDIGLMGQMPRGILQQERLNLRYSWVLDGEAPNALQLLIRAMVSFFRRLLANILKTLTFLAYPLGGAVDEDKLPLGEDVFLESPASVPPGTIKYFDRAPRLQTEPRRQW